MKFKSNIFLASFLISSALFSIPTQAGYMDEFTDLKTCFPVFKKVERGTLPNLLEKAEKRDRQAIKELKRFYGATQALDKYNYVSRGSNTDKTIKHVRDFFQNNAKEVKSILWNSYLKHFRGVTPDTIPNLLNKAKLGDQDAIGSLRKFDENIIDLVRLGYRPPSMGVGLAVRGVKKILEENRNELKILFAKVEPASSPSTVGHASSFSTDLLSVDSKQQFESDTPDKRAFIFKQNKNISQNGYVINDEFVPVDTTRSIQGMKVYGSRDHEYKPNQILKNKKIGQTQVFVVNADTVDHALLMKEMGLNPLALDMANAVSPGGAAHNGEGNAQEENMVFRGNVHDPLYAAYKNAKNRGKLGKSRNFIPKEGGLYIPDVTIFREGANNGYRFMEKPETISIGAIAAYRHKNRAQGKIIDEKYYPELRNETEYWNSTKRKLYSFFDMAIENGHDSLVLSAFGCGAFKNPPENMIQVFEEVLSEYAGCFKEIHFAIYAPKPKDRNLTLFGEAFSGRTY